MTTVLLNSVKTGEHNEHSVCYVVSPVWATMCVQPLHTWITFSPPKSDRFIRVGEGRKGSVLVSWPCLLLPHRNKSPSPANTTGKTLLFTSRGSVRQTAYCWKMCRTPFQLNLKCLLKRRHKPCFLEDTLVSLEAVFYCFWCKYLAGMLTPKSQCKIKLLFFYIRLLKLLPWLLPVLTIVCK